MDVWLLLQWLAYVAIAVGLLGAVLPVLPGAVIIWLGVLLWAWADHFQRVGWLTLLILALIMIAAETSQAWMSALGARKAGASWQALLAGAALGVVGFVLASLPGAILGVVLGIVALESWRHGGLRSGIRSSGGLLLGYVLSAAVQTTLALVMVAIFAWQALGNP